MVLLQDRRHFILSALAIPAAGCVGAIDNPSNALFSSYKVRDPLAGYFDLEARRKLLGGSSNAKLTKLRRAIAKGPSCAQVNSIPIQNKAISLPTFYGDNAGWRKSVRPFWDIENAVSKLAAANLVAADRRYSDCLINLLLAWAQQNALTEFSISDANKQSWFQIEATLFAMALALAAIRPDVQGQDDKLRVIDAWLHRVATKHFSVEGGDGGTCCNNHFYRRALYATIIGVMTRDDDLFQVGPRALHSALSGASAEGALPLEMKRGERAAHYQNYALMYLAMIAQIVERQGYSVWGLEVDGKSLHTLVHFNNGLLANPGSVTKYSGNPDVYLKFHEDSQYFAWFEIYLAQFRNAQMEAWIAPRRPLYNRSLGGHLSAYFYNGR